MLPKINGVTSETMQEIQKRLQSAEAAKARKLLETAMGHMQAFNIVKNTITQQVISGITKNKS